MLEGSLAVHDTGIYMSCGDPAMLNPGPSSMLDPEPLIVVIAVMKHPDAILLYVNA
jgi:hypothetical protein